MRVPDWIDSKVPFMVAIALFLCVFCDSELQGRALYARLGAYFLYVSMFLAFSYVINDYTDIDVDIKAGKHKEMHNMPRPLIVCSMILMILVGTMPMLLLASNRLLFICYTAVLYATGAAYSVPWLLRFKEQGLMGLIECSVAQKCLPLIALMFLFKVRWYYLSLFVIVSFVNGLRYILIHQTLDYENDIKSGVRTYVSEGHHRYRIAILMAFALECAMMLCVMIRMGMQYYFVWVMVPAYALFELAIATVVFRYMQMDWFCTYISVPLESLYNVFFPILMAIVITLRHSSMAGMLILLVLLNTSCFRGKAALVNVYIHARMDRHKERGDQNVRV